MTWQVPKSKKTLLYLLKVRKFQNKNMKSSHCPKYERKFWKILPWIPIFGQNFSNFFVHILGNATTSHFNSEIFWPLVLSKKEVVFSENLNLKGSKIWKVIWFFAYIYIKYLLCKSFIFLFLKMGRKWTFLSRTFCNRFFEYFLSLSDNVYVFSIFW